VGQRRAGTRIRPFGGRCRSLWQPYFEDAAPLPHHVVALTVGSIIHLATGERHLDMWAHRIEGLPSCWMEIGKSGTPLSGEQPGIKGCSLWLLVRQWPEKGPGFASLVHYRSHMDHLLRLANKFSCVYRAGAFRLEASKCGGGGTLTGRRQDAKHGFHFPDIDFHHHIYTFIWALDYSARDLPTLQRWI
jgi:hypothetical protein